MTTASPDTHKMVFLGFLFSHPIQHQKVTRLRMEHVSFQLPVTVACCTNPYSKPSLTFFLLPIYQACGFHPSLSPPPSPLPCPRRPAVSGRFCSRGTADRQAKMGRGSSGRRGGSHGGKQPSPSSSPLRVRGDWKGMAPCLNGAPSMPIVGGGWCAWGWPLAAPGPQAADENPEPRLSDNKDSGELSKGREGPPNNLKWLILVQPTCHPHLGVWRKEEKPRTPRGLQGTQFLPTPL